MKEEKIVKSDSEAAIAFAGWICERGYSATETAIEPKWKDYISGKRYTTYELYKLYAKIYHI